MRMAPPRALPSSRAPEGNQNASKEKTTVDNINSCNETERPSGNQNASKAETNRDTITVRLDSHKQADPIVTVYSIHSDNDHQRPSGTSKQAEDIVNHYIVMIDNKPRTNASQGNTRQYEIRRLRKAAERKVGLLLAEMEKNEGGQAEHESYRLHDATSRNPTLADLGIEKTQSHRWQRVAGRGSATPNER